MKVFWVGLLIACIANASTQIMPLQVQPTQSSPGAPAAPTARDAVRQFLVSARRGDFDTARERLDLSQMSFAIRDAEGIRRAQMLNSVLNRAAGFDPETIPSGSALAKVTIPIRPEDGSATVASVELTPDRTGDWRFSADTVAALPLVWKQIHDHVPVNGLLTDYEGGLSTTHLLRSKVGRHLWREVLTIEIWQWIAIGVLIGVGWFGGRLVRAIAVWPLRRKLGERGLKPLQRLRRSISWGLSSGLWLWALPYLDLKEGAATPIAVAAKVILAIAGVGFGFAVFDITVLLSQERARGLVNRADSIFIPILRNFARAVIVCVAAFGFLSSLDINVTGLIAGLGIGGLVLALAAKDSVENLFGSLTILFDMPFGIGDWVKIGADVNGVVEEINLRSTKVRTFDDSLITVPNSNLTKASVENFGARRQRRINLSLGISHQNDLDRVLGFADKLREFMRGHPSIRPENAFAYVTGLSDAGVSVLVQGYIMTADYEEELRVRQELVEAMARTAAETGVDLGPIHWPLPPSGERRIQG